MGFEANGGGGNWGRAVASLTGRSGGYSALAARGSVEDTDGESDDNATVMARASSGWGRGRQASKLLAGARGPPGLRTGQLLWLGPCFWPEYRQMLAIKVWA